MSDIEETDMVVEESSLTPTPVNAGAYDTNKIKLLKNINIYDEINSKIDDYNCSFQILDEDHTLGNVLRYMIMKNENVEFAGYSIPHPSEPYLHLRIQCYEDSTQTCIQVLHKALESIMDMCDVVGDKFADAVNKYRDSE